MNREVNFTEGKIIRPLFLFTLPILFAMFLQSLYGAVDLIVVGRFAASEDVSGVAIGSQIMFTITNLVNSFAMGATIYLGQKLGAGDRKKSGKIVGTSIVLFLMTGLFLTVLIPLLSTRLAGVMNAPREAFVQTSRYIAICGGGAVMIIAYNVIGSIFRGIGDSRTPLVTVMIASACNIAGDLILVAGLHMGAAGAAIATVASQTISVIISFFLIRKKNLPFEFDRSCMRIDRSICGRIGRFGAPIALQDFLVGLSFLVIQAIVNGLGLTASAGVGVAEKVCAFIMLVPAAFMQAMSAFVAHNVGAGKPKRAVQGLGYAIGVSTMLGALMFVVSFFFGDYLAALFSNDRAVVLAAFDYLKAYAIDCLLTCFLFCFMGFYNGLGHTGFVMIQGIAAAFLVRIPVAWWMSRVSGRLFHIGLGIPCSTVLQIVLCFVFYRRIRNGLYDGKILDTGEEEK